MSQKSVLISLCALFMALYAFSVNAQPLQLAQNGKSEYSIVIANDAIAAEQNAAVQLQKYFGQMTGAQLPIKNENEASADSPQILVGNGTRARALVPGVDWNNLGKDSIVIQSIGKNLVLAGARPRGSLYAVFQFLEEAGCRFWWPGAYQIPTKQTLQLEPQNVVYTPPFAYRQFNSAVSYKDEEFATIMRLNGNRQPQSEAWGGHYEILGWVHTFSQLLPLKKYFANHPEWYSDPSNGYKPAAKGSPVPPAQKTDLCLGNPGVLEELTKNALQWIEKNPGAGYISISQNDNYDGFCRDEYTEELIRKEGSPSAPLIDFVNKVAAKIHEKYPDFLVETLAYHYSEQPPKTIKPAKNVLIRLAPINSDYGHPLNSDKNAAVRDNVLKWEQISPQLFIWNYVTNFSYFLLPHPNISTIGDDLRFFAGHKVTGVYQQGNSHTNDVGDFVPLRNYLISKLLWNPHLDQKQLQQEFLTGYFGAAAPYFERYLQLVNDAYPRDKVLSTFTGDFTFLNLEVMNEATRLFDAAEKAVKNDPVLLKRIETERISIDLVWLLRWRTLKAQAAHYKKDYLGPSNPAEMFQQWKQKITERGVSRFGETSAIQFLTNLENASNTVDAPLPAFVKNAAYGEVFDFQQGEFDLSSRYGKIVEDSQASDRQVARVDGATNGWAIKLWLGTNVGSDLLKGSPWKVVAVARVEMNEGATAEGIGIQGGIYDVTNRKRVNEVKFPLQGDGKYHALTLGTANLDGGMYLWVAPINNPRVKAIYVDRIVIMRERNGGRQ